MCAMCAAGVWGESAHISGGVGVTSRRRKPDRQRQIAAALGYWKSSLAFLKERSNADETRDKRTADDAAACPQRPSEEAGDDEGREGQTHLEPGE